MSLVWNQLETLHPGDIENDPEKRFPRLRALAFGVCGFQKYTSPRTLLRPFKVGYDSAAWML